MLGSTEPRLWTPPLRELTPETSFGFEHIEWTRTTLGIELDPWEQWASIHAGELLPDGRPRFRVVLILVARQNGKTLWAKTFILYWIEKRGYQTVLGTSTDRNYAKKAWRQVCELAQERPAVAEHLAERPVREVIGEEALRWANGAEYFFAANNQRAGRSATVDGWLCDELREHRSFAAWDAAKNAMNARPFGQIVCITNQGDAQSVVLDSLRTPALDHIRTGEGDPRLGLFEWSAPDGADPTSSAALAQANPNLGYRIDMDALMGSAIAAKRAGGEVLAGFRTEVLCQRVTLLDPAIDMDQWAACGTSSPVDLATHRDRLALCLDVSLDMQHATVAAAAALDGTTHLEAVAAWDGPTCTRDLRRELPALVDKLRPRTLGWFPGGPAAAIAAGLAERRGPHRWPPRGVTVEEIRGDVTAVCMGLEEQVRTGELRHNQDPLLTAHVENSMPLRRGDAWVFTRRGAGPVDGAYAAAGAAHLARVLPPPRPKISAV